MQLDIETHTHAPGERSKCPACGAAIVFARVADTGRMIALDARNDRHGYVLVGADGLGGVRVLKGDPSEHTYGSRYRAHTPVNCPAK